MNGQRPAVAGGGGDRREKLYPLVQDLIDPSRREAALLELSKHRELYPDLAPILWHSFGVIAALLQEIVSIYPLLSPPKLSAPQSNRMCNALALLQCVASHNETRQLFLKGAWPSPPPAARRCAFLTSPSSLPPPAGPRRRRHSANSALPLPLPQHRQHREALRVPAPHIAGRDRRAGQGASQGAGAGGRSRGRRARR